MSLANILYIKINSKKIQKSLKNVFDWDSFSLQGQVKFIKPLHYLIILK